MPYKDKEKQKEYWKQKGIEYTQGRKDGYFSVYYLPEENYCGTTSQVERRMYEHDREGKNIDGWKVLYCSEDRKDAYYHEALFQSTLAMEGLNYNMK